MGKLSGEVEYKRPSSEVIELYKECSNIHIIKLPVMTDDQYNSIKEVFEFCGYKWSEKLKGFMNTEDKSQELHDIFYGGKVYHIDKDRKVKEENQFYPTPLKLAKQCQELCEFKVGDVVLEPSAGTGNMLEGLSTSISKIVIEPFIDNIKVLKSKGYNVIESKFEDVVSLGVDGLMYNKVSMNPPFSGCRDALHVMKAYDGLADKGILVAIVNENMLHYGNPISIQFNTFLKKVKAELIDVPVGSFKESGTMVNTVIVKIKKDRDSFGTKVTYKSLSNHRYTGRYAELIGVFKESPKEVLEYMKENLVVHKYKGVQSPLCSSDYDELCGYIIEPADELSEISIKKCASISVASNDINRSRYGFFSHEVRKSNIIANINKVLDDTPNMLERYKNKDIYVMEKVRVLREIEEVTGVDVIGEEYNII